MAFIPTIATMAVGMAQWHQVVDIQVACGGKGLSAVGIVPASAGHGASIIPGKGHGHLAGGNQDLRAGVLAVAILIQPVGPVTTLIEAGKGPLLLAGFLFRLLLLAMQGQAGFTVAVLLVGGPVGVAALRVQAAGVAGGEAGDNDQEASKESIEQKGSPESSNMIRILPR